MSFRLDPELEAATPRSLNARAAHEWRSLTRQVLHGRSKSICSNTNEMLRSAAQREPESPAATAFHMWIADNFLRDGDYAEAIEAYDLTINSAAVAPRLLDDHNPILGALHHKARSAVLIGDPALAIKTYEELAKYDSTDSGSLFQAGLIAEQSGDFGQAATFYRRAGKQSKLNRTDNPAELARRALARLESPPSAFASDARQVADYLTSALERRDAAQLAGAASKTHFVAGAGCTHASFDTDGILDLLFEDLKKSRVRGRRTLMGTGDKLYLQTRGWRGRWFRGDLIFLITRAPAGWQWTGLVIASPNDLWIDRWRPAVLETNQPLPFELLAPWPAGQCFMAGGLTAFAIMQATVVAALYFAPIVAFAYSRNRCGFGLRGFYYNQGSTHDGEDAFAIDFTRYKQYVPYYPLSGGTPVLAARGGMVQLVRSGTPSGDSSTSNTVEITHADPADPSKPTRFRSRYLHLEGPNKITVSEMMEVPVGTRLGLMDDTGNSLINHLHFSIHDRDLPRPGAPHGASVRPTPMSGVRLEDGDDATCICSNNVEYVEKPMIEITEFAGQNWVITPAAVAANETPPSRIQDQKFLMVMSGVALLGLKGSSTSQWRRETILIRPDIEGPMKWAIGKYGIPTPPGTSGANFWTAFQVEQWAPFAAVSSIYNKDESDNSGFAVDVWRPNPFNFGPDAFSNATLHNLFTGIQVDVAVRDTDAYLYRVSYNFTLLGKIVFGPIIIT